MLPKKMTHMYIHAYLPKLAHHDQDIQMLIAQRNDMFTKNLKAYTWQDSA
jgi:predicted SprT family Zn-dependent metalloprotease